MKKDWKKFDITDSFQDMFKTPKAKKYKTIIVIELVVITIYGILLALAK